MKTLGTKDEVLKYLTEEFSLSGRPLVPKTGDRREVNEKLSFKNQLNSLTSAASTVFYMECEFAPENLSAEAFPEIKLSIKSIPVVITDFNPTQ